MLDEVIFMQTRLFRMFCDKTKTSPIEANSIFEKYEIWEFIDECYDILHLSSDENALEDIINIIKAKGGSL